MRTSDFVILMLALAYCACVAEARGGRGRGGGSLGGLLGGWRKNRKTSSSGSGGAGGSSRRVMSASPMHTELSSSAGSSSGLGLGFGSGKMGKTKAGYPRQQMPYGASGYAYGTASGAGAGYAPQPTYYASPATLPQGAYYYAQSPYPRSTGSSGTGNFLMGMVAGHMINKLLFPGSQRQHYAPWPQHANATDDVQRAPTVIVVNHEQHNGTTKAPAAEPQADPDTDASFEADLLNAMATVAVAPESPPTEASTAAPENVSSTTPPAPAPGSIVCFPILVNQTDSAAIEQIVCFTMPPAAPDCAPTSYSQADPNDPSKTITVEHKECLPALTDKPPVVAGDIGVEREEHADASSGETNSLVTPIL